MGPTFYSITVQTSTAMITMLHLVFITPGTGSHGGIGYPRFNTITVSRSTAGETTCLAGLPGTPSSVDGVHYRKKMGHSISFSKHCNTHELSTKTFLAEGKEKETHELIFSWLSWLAVLLVGAYAGRRRRSRARWRPYFS